MVQIIDRSPSYLKLLQETKDDLKTIALQQLYKDAQVYEKSKCV